nr:hypothetical protein [Tanacetum cinerariifolium]
MVGYQGVVAKVSAFYTKNLAQPWHTMFKTKDVIQYPHFTRLIITDLMKKFPNISKRIDMDYHSIKDDIPLSLKVTIRQKKVIEGEKDDDDSDDRLELESHKKNPELVDDDDDKDEEKELTDTVLVLIATTSKDPHLKRCISSRDDDFHSHGHDDHQEDDSPPEGEKGVKRHKVAKRTKSTRGSSSKQSAKDSTIYVTKQQSQQ